MCVNFCTKNECIYRKYNQKKKFPKVVVGLNSNGYLLLYLAQHCQANPGPQKKRKVVPPKRRRFGGQYATTKKKKCSGNFAAAASSPFHAATKKTACSRPAVSPVAARPSIAAASLSLARTLSLLPSPAREPPAASALISYYFFSGESIFFLYSEEI